MTSDKVKQLQEEYQELKRQSNLSLVPVGVLCILFLFLKNSLLLCLACAVLILGLVWNKKKTKAHEDQFRKEGVLFSEQLLRWVQNTVPGAAADTSGCGYLCQEGHFANMIWVISQDHLHLFEMPIHTDLVYSIDGEFRFLFSLDQGCKLIGTYPLSSLQFRRHLQNHQDFLREQAMRTNQILVVQSFLYEKVCTQAREHNVSGRIQMDSEIGRLRKETLYLSPLPGSKAIYVTEKQYKNLSNHFKERYDEN